MILLLASKHLFVVPVAIALLFIMPPSAEALRVQPSFVPTGKRTTSSPVLRNRHGALAAPTKQSIRPPPFVRCSSSFCTGCLPQDLVLCQAVSDLSEGDASSSSSSSSSSEDTTATPTGKFVGLQQRVFSGNNGGMTIKERLIKASNFASFLCVLDVSVTQVIRCGMIPDLD